MSINKIMGLAEGMAFDDDSQYVAEARYGENTENGRKNSLSAVQFKNKVAKALKEAGYTVAIKSGHNYFSGFINNGTKFAYVNITDDGQFMYRTAKDGKDFSGGSNQFAKSVEDMVSGIVKILGAVAVSEGVENPSTEKKEQLEDTFQKLKSAFGAEVTALGEKYKGNVFNVKKGFIVVLHNNHRIDFIDQTEGYDEKVFSDSTKTNDIESIIKKIKSNKLSEGIDSDIKVRVVGTDIPEEFPEGSEFSLSQIEALIKTASSKITGEGEDKVRFQNASDSENKQGRGFTVRVSKDVEESLENFKRESEGFASKLSEGVYTTDEGTLLEGKFDEAGEPVAHTTGKNQISPRWITRINFVDDGQAKSKIVSSVEYVFFAKSNAQNDAKRIVNAGREKVRVNGTFKELVVKDVAVVQSWAVNGNLDLRKGQKILETFPVGGEAPVKETPKEAPTKEAPKEAPVKKEKQVEESQSQFSRTMMIAEGLVD